MGLGLGGIGAKMRFDSLEKRISDLEALDVTEAPDYLVYDSGLRDPLGRAIIYAKNCKTGKVEFKGLASDVIQSAINSLTKGGVIFFKAGNYTIAQTIRLPSGVTLMGEAVDDLSYRGFGTRLIADGALSGPVLTNKDHTDGNGNITIKMLVIDGNKPSNDKVTGCDGIYLKNTVRCRLIDMVVYRMKNNGIFVEGGGETQIHRVYVSQNNADGIIMSTHSDFHISECEIGSNLTNGITLSSCSNGLIIGCHIYLNIYGVRCFNARLMRIIGNRMNHNARDGISITISASGWDRIIVVGNQCLCNGRSFTGHNGITITGTSTLVMQGVIVVGNVCWDYESPKTQEYGIAETVNANYNIIVNNDVRENKVGGIQYIGSNTIVRHNIGYVTENDGTATIASGTNSVTVNHGLSNTPRIVLVTGSHAETSDAVVTSVTSTSFTITVPSNVTANRTVYWMAQA
jgi:hypothetical protein